MAKIVKPNPSSSPRKPGRSPLQVIVVWGGIAILLVIVGTEWWSQRGHSRTVAVVEQRFAGAQAGGASLEEKDLSQVAAGWYWKAASGAEGTHLTEMRWPSLFKTYSLQLRVTADGIIRAYSINQDLATPNDGGAPVTVTKQRTVVKPVKPGTVSTIENMVSEQVLSREMVRQAILAAARDEFQLPTRDPILREDSVSDDPDGKDWPFEVQARVTNYVEVEVSVQRVTPEKRYTVVVDQYRDMQGDRFMKDLAKAEIWSTTTFPKALADGGYQRANRQQGTEPAAIPEAAGPLVNALDPISQFVLLRMLHEELATKPESTEARCALARSYAMLGSLTELHWSVTHKVFKARALLSAQRAVHLWPNSAEAWATRAYVLALVGRHDDALKDVKQAESLATGSLPEWLDAVSAFCGWDAEGLKVAATRDPIHAAYFQLLASELMGTDDQRRETARSQWQAAQPNLRAGDILALDSALGVRHEIGASGFPYASLQLAALLAVVPQIPEDVRNIAKDVAGGDRIPPQQLLKNVDWEVNDPWHVRASQALRRAGAIENDRQEPSWQVLATVVEDALMVHILSRLDLERFKLAVPTIQSLQEIAPHVKGHPLAPLLAGFSSDEVAARKAIADARPLLEKLEYSEGSRALWTMDYFVNNGNRIVGERLSKQRDDILSDHVAGTRSGNRSDERVAYGGLRRTATRSPLFAAISTGTGWDAPDTDRADWATRYANDPRMLRVVAEKEEEEEHFEEAEKVYVTLKEKHPSPQSYWLLANFYQKRDRWPDRKRTLIELVKQPSEGLEQAQAADILSHELLERGENEEALRYGLAAAGSYSAWGLICAADCYEALGDWKRAEPLVRACAERYEDSAGMWYLWCRHTGKGDLDSARQLAQEYFKRKETVWDKSTLRFETAGHLEMEGELQKAYELDCEGTTDSSPRWANTHCFRAAVLAHRLNRPAERDQWIAQLASSHEDHSLPMIARTLRRCLAQGNTFTDDELNWFAETAWADGAWTNNCYTLGQCLLMLKDEKRAIPWFERSASSPIRQKFSRTLAGITLQRLGREIPARRPTEFDLTHKAAFGPLNEGTRFMQEKRYNMAHDRFAEAVKAAPEWVLPLYESARSLRWLRRGKEGETELNLLIERNPRSADLFWWRSEMRLERGKVAGAIEDAQTGLKLDPHHGPLHHHLAWIRIAVPDDPSRDPAAAAAHLEKSRSKAPENKLREMALDAALAAEKGDFPTAIALEEQVLTQSPSEDKFISQMRLNAYRKGQPYRMWLRKESDEKAL